MLDIVALFGYCCKKGAFKNHKIEKVPIVREERMMNAKQRQPFKFELFSQWEK